ncbi:MAG TPA: hypothetical protein VHU42_11815, partial [Rhodopila sp.]|nr:hypothetical protein [Rhodopila sp.]
MTRRIVVALALRRYRQPLWSRFPLGRLPLGAGLKIPTRRATLPRWLATRTRPIMARSIMARSIMARSIMARSIMTRPITTRSV